jgi:hypothetical protein
MCFPGTQVPDMRTFSGVEAGRMEPDAWLPWSFDQSFSCEATSGNECIVPSTIYLLHSVIGARGGAAVEALRYKLEDREIDSLWCHWKCSLT